MIDALIAGRLYGKPAERTSASGNQYVTAKVRVSTRDGEAPFVSVIAFNRNAVTALLALGDGDSVCLTGELTAKAYSGKAGEPKPSLELLAHQCLTEYHVARRRNAIREPDRRAVPGDLPFNGDLPGAA